MGPCVGDDCTGIYRDYWFVRKGHTTWFDDDFGRDLFLLDYGFGVPVAKQQVALFCLCCTIILLGS